MAGQLDADIATLAPNLPVYIAAVNALIAGLPDVATDDASVQSLITAVQNAQNALPPPPGPAAPAQPTTNAAT